MKLDLAFALLALGFSVFPLRARSKQPDGAALPTRYNDVKQAHVSTWSPFQSERASIEQVRSWFAHTARNLAIVTGRISGIVVIDTDNPVTEAWAAAHLPSTPLIVTTARGRHRYFRWLPDLPKFLHVDGLPPIELKGDGQYVLGPGSVHPTGAIYTIEGGRLPSTVYELPVFPIDLLADRRAPAALTLSGEGYEFPARAESGERHHELFKLIRSLKALGADRETAVWAVRQANTTRCYPPLKDDHAFAAWIERAWTNPDRPLPPRAEPSIFGKDSWAKL